MVSFVVLSAFVAYSSWRAEAGKRQTDATLRYFDPLMDREYIRYLWEVEEFTLCYERAAEGICPMRASRRSTASPSPSSSPPAGGT